MARPMTDADRVAALGRIAKSKNPEELKRMIVNAAAVGEDVVMKAAQRRFYAVSPSQEPGTLEHAVWQSVHALESALSDESGITKRLSRTRQKISRDGEQKTVSDLILGKPSAGFAMLVERDMVEFTFEAVALRFPDLFNSDVLERARARIAEIAEK